MYIGLQGYEHKEGWQWDVSTSHLSMIGYKEMKKCIEKISKGGH